MLSFQLNQMQALDALAARRLREVVLARISFRHADTLAGVDESTLGAVLNTLQGLGFANIDELCGAIDRLLAIGRLPEPLARQALALADAILSNVTADVGERLNFIDAQLLNVALPKSKEREGLQ